MSGAFQRVVSLALRGGVAAFALALYIHGSTKRPAKMPIPNSAAQTAAPATKKTAPAVAAVPGIPDPPAPEGTVAATNWWRRGAWSDWRRIDFPPGWSFPWGTGRVTSVALLARGAVLPNIRATNALTEVGVPLALRPLDSVCWHGPTPSNSYAFGWGRAYANRDPAAPADARIELFRNGDSAVTLNGVTTRRRRVPPFRHDGIGQDADWLAANFTNAAEIASVGYADWVAGRVNAVRGLYLYRLRVTFAAPPPEDVLLTVGKFRVLVREAGAYDFLLGKGVRHAVAMSFVPGGVSYSWDDGGAAKVAAQSSAENPSQTLEFVAEGAAGRTMFEPPEGADAEGFILWIPTLSVYAGSPKYGFPVRFWAFADLPPGCPYDIAWKSDDGSVTGTGDGIWIYEPVTWKTVAVTLRYPEGRITGRVTARRFVAETRLTLAAPKAVVFERTHTNAPGETVPMRSSALRATAAWATAEAGTVRLACEPAGAFAAVSDGVKAPLPCEWASARNAADSREVVLEGGAALAEAGGAAKLTLTFTPDGGGAAIEESAEIRAYELRVEAVSDWPSNKFRHVFGPLEEATLSITPLPESVEWRIDSRDGDNLTFKYTAAPVPKKAKGVVSVEGVSFTFDLETIAPERLQAGGFRATEDWDWHMIEFVAPQDGEIGVGLAITNIVLRPDWVSFANVDIREGFCLATNMWGIFDFPNAQSTLYAHGDREGAGKIMEVSGENEIGDDFAAISFLEIKQPWWRGGFLYDIPLSWRVRNRPWQNLWHPFGITRQSYEFHANGDMTVEKFGFSVTRGTNGVSRTTKEQ